VNSTDLLSKALQQYALFMLFGVRALYVADIHVPETSMIYLFAKTLSIVNLEMYALDTK